MRTIAFAAAIFLASPAFAQVAAVTSHTIDVTGHGKVSVPPDTASIHYWVRGEGKTPDDATRAMSNSQREVETGLKGFLGGNAQIANSGLVVIEVRAPSCKSQPGQAALSEGECAIIGYLAQSQTDVTTPTIDKAGTAVGLASRLGARDARLQGFELRETAVARKAAMTSAVNDARQQAQVLASATGGHVGRVLDIRYNTYNVTEFANRVPVVAAPAPPPPPPPPVQIDLKPRPQEISADVYVSYELLP